ncbi:MAG: PIN domain-containing protein [Acidobacteriota bacterium]
MNNLVIVDTSAWIFALRKNYNLKIKNRIEQLLRDNEIAIIPIIKLELLAGTRTEKEFSRLKMRLDALTQVEIDEEKWQEAYKIAFQLRRKDIDIPFIDIIIISCAKIVGALIVHADKHFDLVGKYIDLKLQSYASELI